MRHTLFSAAASNNIRQLKRYIQNRANLDQRNEHEQTALMLAAENGHAEAIFLLLSAGANATLTTAIDNNDQRATALALVLLCHNNEDNVRKCVLAFAQVLIETNIYQDESFFFSQNRVNSMTARILEILNYYDRHPNKKHKVISQLPCLPQPHQSSF